MMADAKIVIDGDSRGLVRALTQATSYMQKLAEESDKNSTKIEKGFSRATLKIDAIKRALTSAGQAADQAVTKMESASKTQREGRLRIAEIGAGEGLTGAQIGMLQRNVEAAPGPTSIEERIQFLQSVTKARGRRKISAEDLNNALLAYSAGGDVAFGRGGEDVISLMQKRRIPVAAAMEQVFRQRAPGAIPTLATPEAREKATLELFQRETTREGARLGAGAELQRARLEYIKAESPTMGAVAEYLSNLSGGMTDRLLGVQSGIRDDSGENVRLLTEIVGNTRRPPPRPQIGAQGEGAK